MVVSIVIGCVSVFGILAVRPHIALQVAGYALIIVPLCDIILTRSFSYRLVGLGVALFSLEMVGVMTGFVYGSFSYHASLVGLIAGTPLAMVLIWSVLVLNVHSLVGTRYSRVLTAIITGICLVVFDMAVDPALSYFGLWTWHETNSVSWFGVPFTNFVGWFAVGSLGSMIAYKRIPPVACGFTWYLTLSLWGWYTWIITPFRILALLSGVIIAITYWVSSKKQQSIRDYSKNNCV